MYADVTSTRIEPPRMQLSVLSFQLMDIPKFTNVVVDLHRTLLILMDLLLAACILRHIPEEQKYIDSLDGDLIAQPSMNPPKLLLAITAVVVLYQAFLIIHELLPDGVF